MPIINYKTDLTSLKYGKDRPGGGDSGQPYMQFPIDNAQAPTSIRAFYEANRTALDFPVRGGAITQLITGGAGIITSTIDRERIQKFFKDSPRGTAFIQKQVGLQLTNPRLQVPNGIAFAGPSLGNAFIPVTSIYTPANTIAQVQAQGTGAHFNRHGVAPTIYERPEQTYAYIVGAPQNNTETTNRLSILKALKLIGSADYVVNRDLVGGSGIDPTLVDKMGISPLQGQLFNYQGGPGSVYGIGSTRIARTVNTNITVTSDTNPDPNFTVQGEKRKGVAYSTIALTYAQLAEQGDNGYIKTQQPVQDFRDQLPIGTGRDAYKVFNRELPYKKPTDYGGGGGLGLGNPGNPSKGPRYLDPVPNGSDLLNLINPLVPGKGATNNQSSPFYDPSQIDPWTAAGNDSKDIIKFAFECLDNDNISDSVALIFRAMLEGQITDTNQASFQDFKYLGRGETFRTYEGFDRTISFTFKLFVQSRQEMLPLYIKLNQLISQVYPDYSPQYNLMRGNIVKLTIGDYLYRTPGFLENVNVTIDNSNTPWEIVLNQYATPTSAFQETGTGPTGIEEFNVPGTEENDVRQLPHLVTVQCTFKPIMDLLPRKVSKNNPFVPLIVNKDHFIDPNATTPALRNSLTSPMQINPPYVAKKLTYDSSFRTTNPFQSQQPRPQAGRGLRRTT